MITSMMRWNEPNNLSHWDFQMDPDWRQFRTMTRCAAKAIKELAPHLKLVLGGISPIDPAFIRLPLSYGTMEHLDAVGVRGFPRDWNHWRINDGPAKIKEIEDTGHLPVWVTELGGLAPPERPGLVRSSDAGSGGFLRDGHAVLHAAIPRTARLPHLPLRAERLCETPTAQGG